jgi:gas vesicle protein
MGSLHLDSRNNDLGMASKNRNNYDNENNGLAPFLWGVLAGGLVGAAFALLYAPKPGTETRRDLRFRLDDMTDSINDLINKATGKEAEFNNESRDRGARIVDAARTKASDLIENADRTIAEARRRAQSGEASAPNADGVEQRNNTNTDLPPDAINDAL